MVPTRMIRKSTRAGVMNRTLTRRRRRRSRGDVAVAGGGERHDRVVEAVEQGQAVLVDVAVAVAVQVDAATTARTRPRAAAAAGSARSAAPAAARENGSPSVLLRHRRLHAHNIAVASANRAREPAPPRRPGGIRSPGTTKARSPGTRPWFLVALLLSVRFLSSALLPARSAPLTSAGRRCRRPGLPLRVRVRVRRHLHRLRRLGQRHIPPTLHLRQGNQKRNRRILRITDLLHRPPTTGRTLLEQALRVMIVAPPR